MASYPSYLQHPSSYSNVSQNCVPSVLPPNPSKHSNVHLLKPTTASSPDDTGHHPHRGRSSAQTTALLPKICRGSTNTVLSWRSHRVFSWTQQGCWCHTGTSKLGGSWILPAPSQPSPWPLHSSAPCTSPDQQPAQHLHTFFTPPMSHVLPDLTGALITSKTAQAQPPFLPLTLLVFQGKELFHRTLCHCRTSPTILDTSLTHLMSRHTGHVPVESCVTGLDSHHTTRGRAALLLVQATSGQGQVPRALIHPLIPIPFGKQPGQGGRKGMQSSPPLHFPIDSQ